MMFKRIIPLLLCVSCYADELPKKGFFTQASLLYWQAEEDGLSYAINSTSMSSLSPDAKTLKPVFEWDFGFNLGFGYRVPHDRWQLLIQFTSLQTHCDAEKTASEDRVFFPVWIAPTPTTLFASEVKMHWRLHFALIDALLSKPYTATQSLTLTPQMGVRWASSRQKFNIAYRGGNFPLGEDVLIRMKNKFQGLGPYASLTGEYSLGQGFSLLAKGAASLLYGEFYLHQDEDTLGTKEKLLGLHSIYRSISPLLEASAGVRWQRQFSGSLKRLTLDLLWDQLLFFSQNQMVRFTSDAALGVNISNQGDLSLAGVQFSFALAF